MSDTSVAERTRPLGTGHWYQKDYQQLAQTLHWFYIKGHKQGLCLEEYLLVPPDLPNRALHTHCDPETIWKDDTDGNAALASLLSGNRPPPRAQAPVTQGSWAARPGRGLGGCVGPVCHGGLRVTQRRRGWRQGWPTGPQLLQPPVLRTKEDTGSIVLLRAAGHAACSPARAV